MEDIPSLELDFPNAPEVLGDFFGFFIAYDWIKLEFLEALEKVKTSRNASVKLLIAVFSRIASKTTISHAKKLYNGGKIRVESLIVGDKKLETFFKPNQAEKLSSIFSLENNEDKN